MSELPDPSCCEVQTETALEADRVEDIAAVMAALGDPIRLQIYTLIASGGEVCSCNLEGPVGKSQPTISHHTAKLAAAGLIIGERRGRWMWWRIEPTRFQAIVDTVAKFATETSTLSR